MHRKTLFLVLFVAAGFAGNAHAQLLGGSGGLAGDLTGGLGNGGGRLGGTLGGDLGIESTIVRDGSGRLERLRERSAGRVQQVGQSGRDAAQTTTDRVRATGATVRERATGAVSSTQNRAETLRGRATATATGAASSAVESSGERIAALRETAGEPPSPRQPSLPGVALTSDGRAEGDVSASRGEGASARANASAEVRASAGKNDRAETP